MRNCIRCGKALGKNPTLVRYHHKEQDIAGYAFVGSGCAIELRKGDDDEREDGLVLTLVKKDALYFSKKVAAYEAQPFLD